MNVTIVLVLLLAGAGAMALAAEDADLTTERGWPILSWKGAPLTQVVDGPAADLNVDGNWLLSEAKAAPRAVATAGGFDVVYETALGTVTDRFTRFGAFPRCYARQLLFKNAKDRRRDVDGVRLHLAFRAPEDAPAQPAGSGTQARAAPRRRTARYRGGPGLGTSHSRLLSWQCQSFAMAECVPGGPSVCAGFTSDEDFYDTGLGHDGRATHTVHSAWRLEPGQEAAIGTQYLWVVPGSLEKARASAQDWYDAVGLTVAEGGPPWVGDLALYQACAGGSVDSRFSDTGGFAPFARQLDLISDMGFNAFWLMSVLTHKDPTSPATGWNLYDPADYHQIDPAYGGEEGLTALVKAMRARGFRILSEIVPHGGRAPLCVAHPEWWTYAPDGSRARSFGQALDYSAPGWQATIREAIAWMARGWGFDGWRVDVADGYGTNWAAERAPHVSRSTMGGSLGMLRAIREGHLESGRPPLITPESGVNRPEHARYGQLGYGFELIFFLENLHPAALPPEELRARLTSFFERERGSLPRGMLSIRALNNHDAVVFWGRADRRFGVGLQRALTGVCAVVPGVPMVYQEQEVGSYAYFRDLFWGRRQVPEMRRGDADYLGVRTHPAVFAVLRAVAAGKARRRALGLVNLSPEPVPAAVTLPPGVIPTGGCMLYDAVSGRSIRARSAFFRWPLARYATAILRIGRPPEGLVPPERHHAESGRPPQAPPTSGALGGPAQGDARLRWWVDGGTVLHVRAPGLSARFDPAGHPVRYERAPGSGGVRVVLGVTGDGRTEDDDEAEAEADGEQPNHPTTQPPNHPSLQVFGVDRWLANTVTGVYEDRLLRRHYPWPKGLYEWNPKVVWGYEPHNLYRAVLPAGRQWQSAAAPLLPADARLGFAGTSGRGFALAGVETNAANVVLTDRSEKPDPEPYGVTLRFAATDEALNPGWVPGYRSFQWREVPSPASAPSAEPLHVSFTLTPLGSFVATVRAMGKAGRTSSCRMQVGKGETHMMGDRLWLVEPNEVAWAGLPLSKAGTYDLWMQLRHSEAGPEGRDLCEHYRVSVDGRPVALEWVRLNVWSTGNGYLAWARARGLSLEAGRHAVRIATTHTWCALLPTFTVSRDPNWQP